MAEKIDVVKLNLSDLTLGEIEEIEDLSGRSIDSVSGEGPKAKLMRAMAFIAKRREDPTFTYEQTADLVLEVTSEDLPPTESSDS